MNDDGEVTRVDRPAVIRKKLHDQAWRIKDADAIILRLQRDAEMSTSRLQGLIEQWRKDAKADARHGVKHALGSNREHFGGVNYALAKAECADELAAALKEPTE